MTLALPLNVASRSDRDELLHRLLLSMSGPVTAHVLEGQFAANCIAPNDFRDITSGIASCSIIYVLSGSRGSREPIAAFVANESLRTAKLEYLIDDCPPAADKIPRRTLEMIGVYIRSLFADIRWVDVVVVPSNVHSLDGMFELAVESEGDTSRISLVDLGHRPQSSRSWA